LARSFRAKAPETNCGLLGLAAAGQALRNLQKQFRGAMVGRNLGNHLAIVRRSAEDLRLERNGYDRLALDGLGELAVEISGRFGTPA
jgi:hypothetical protein